VVLKFVVICISCSPVCNACDSPIDRADAVHAYVTAPSGRLVQSTVLFVAIYDTVDAHCADAFMRPYFCLTFTPYTTIFNTLFAFLHTYSFSHFYAEPPQ